MVVPKQKVDIPIVGGLAQHVEARVVVPQQRLLEARNVYFDKRGRLSKRHGFTPMTDLQTNGVDPVPGARAIFSTGEELCIVGPRRIWGYLDTLDRWTDRGPVSPFGGKLNEKFHSAVNHDLADVDKLGDYLLYGAARAALTDEFELVGFNLYSTFAIEAFVETVDGQRVVDTQIYDEAKGNTSDPPYGPRCAHAADKLMLFYHTGQRPGPVDINRLSWNIASPTTPPGSKATPITDCYATAADEGRMYDVIGLDHVTEAGDYIVAYIVDPTQDWKILRYNSAHAIQVQNTNIAFDWYRIAIAESPTQDVVYLLAAAEVVGVDTVYLYAIRSGPLSVLWGPIVIATLPSPAISLGVAEVNSRVVCLWSEGDSTSNRSVRASDGAGFDAAYKMWHTALKSRPFGQDGRAYAVLSTTEDKLSSGERAVAVNSTFIADLMTNEVNPKPGGIGRVPILVGVLDVGAGQFSRRVAIGSLPRGAGNNVVETVAGQWHTMGERISQIAERAERRVSCDELVMTFGEAPLVTVSSKGAAIIGGGCYTWYEGGSSHELGIVQPPVVVSSTPTTVDGEDYGTVLPEGTYSYLFIWEMYGPRGLLHRSIPGNLDQQLVELPHNAVLFTINTTAATSRSYKGLEVNCVGYRAGADGVFKRFTKPVRLEPNNLSVSTITILDHGQQFDGGTNSGTGPPLYTDGQAELPAACPEGGRLAQTIKDRVWLGDTWRRSRVQPSKSFAPSTALEDQIVPEFDDLLGFILASGLEVTGLGDLDDKVAVFTPDEVLVVAGDGPDNAGLNNTFSPLTPVSDDAGCTEPRSVVSYPGGVMFRSKAGIYLLTRSLELAYIGEPVEDLVRQYPVVTSAVLVADQQQVRFTCNEASGLAGVILVYDYEKKQWSRWDVTSGEPRGYVPMVSACVHNGVYRCVTAEGLVYREDSATWYDSADQWVTSRGRIAWLQGAGMNGWQRVWSAFLRLEWHDYHALQLEAYHDFEPSAFQTRTWTEDEISEFSGLPDRYQPRLGIERQKCQAISVAWQDNESAHSSTGQGYSISGLSLELGVKGTVRVPSTQRS
jgi:hypothetical protein